ncbi:VirK family protein [Xanthomonas tesorieronis]|uniref:VirK family protein n=1 Tax=Xanthomonas tesorieronis TaxID=3160839 RepID=UPI0035116A15
MPTCNARSAGYPPPEARLIPRCPDRSIARSPESDASAAIAIDLSQCRPGTDNATPTQPRGGLRIGTYRLTEGRTALLPAERRHARLPLRDLSGPALHCQLTHRPAAARRWHGTAEARLNAA